MHRGSAQAIPSLVRIAKLENGVVKLNEEQLKAISPKISHLKVAVVSVIGRSEEQRRAVVKALFGCLYEEATAALIANETKNELDAIFAVFPPRRIFNECGTEIAVLILDISCPHYAVPTYSKLASLCLLVSSVVIYTASCNADEMTNINIDMSELNPVGPSSVNINHMWVIVQDCDSSDCSKPGAARLLTAEYEHLGLSESTKDEVLMLARYSASAIRILLAKRSSDVEAASLQEDSVEYNLTLKKTCCIILKRATQIEGVILGFLMPYFRQKWCPAEAQMGLANASHSCKSSSLGSCSSDVKQSVLFGNRATTCSSRGRARVRRLFQNYPWKGTSTPFKSDIKEMKSARAEPVKIHSTNEMYRNEYEEGKNFEQRSGFFASTVSETSTRDQGKREDTITVGRWVPEIRGTNTATVGVQPNLAALKSSTESVRMDVSLEAEDCTVEIWQKPQPMEVDMTCESVSLYRESDDGFMEQSSPFFREIHQTASEELQNIWFITPSDPHDIEANTHEGICQRNMQPEVALKEITQKSSTSASFTRPNFWQAHFYDRVVVENAVQYSLECYTELMGSLLLPHNIYTVKYIKDVHDCAGRYVLEAFSFQKFTPTFQKAKEKLEDILSTSLQERLEANFAMMRKLDKEEEKLRRMCGMYYKDIMSTKMSEKTVSSGSAQEIHEEAMHDTKQWFRKQCKDVPEPIKDYWEKVLDVKLEFWKTYYMDKSGVKEDLPLVTGFSLSAQNEHPTKKASVGIYFGPDVVQFGLYSSDIETFNQSCVEILPLICFKDAKILIGDEAKNCNSRIYNVFDIISHPTATNQPKYVKLYAKHFSLTSSEIAVLFFHEAKKKFESSVKTQVETCVVAASGLLPSASKQGLISALTLSGISHVKFMPSTTAILVWYLNWRQGPWYKNTQKEPKVLVVHHAGPLVEVVKAGISAGQHLNIKRIGGFLNYNDFNEPTGGKVIQSAICEAISKAKGQSRNFERILMIHESQADAIIMGIIHDIVSDIFDSAHCELQSNRHILFSAAAYHADNNGDKSVSVHWPCYPTFNHLFPHELSIEIPWRERMTFPSSGSERHSVALRRSERSFLVCESKESPKILFRYACSYAQAIHSSPIVVFDLTLRHNGTFKISGAPLTYPNFQFISDFDLACVKKQIAEVIFEKERFMEKSKSRIDTPEENAAEDLLNLKSILRSQLEDVKQRLQVSGNSIKPMILEGINDRVKACEKLLSRQDVKEKQVNIAIGQLKVSANRIPST